MDTINFSLAETWPKLATILKDTFSSAEQRGSMDFGDYYFCLYWQGCYACLTLEVILAEEMGIAEDTLWV